MDLAAKDLQTLCSIAALAAREAGALIADYSQRAFAVQHKSGCESLATQVVTEVDELSQAIILKRLSPSFERFDIALLSEEREDDGSRLEKQAFWCIDPLDGTLPFTQRKPGYAVSIALLAKSGAPMIGVIFDPVENILIEAIAGVGVLRNGQSFNLHTAGVSGVPLYYYCDCSFETHPQRTQMVANMELVAQALGSSDLVVKIGGGAVMNACHVLQHPSACYFKLPKMKAGGGSIWDFAATAAVFQCLDVPATNFHGERMDLNRTDSTFMNHEGVMYASHPAVARAVREAFASSQLS